MAETITQLPPLVQAYDYSREREYIKHYQGLIFGYERVVRAESLEQGLVLRIDCDRTPDKIILNGKEVTLTPSLSGQR